MKKNKPKRKRKNKYVEQIFPPGSMQQKIQSARNGCDESLMNILNIILP